MYGPLNHSFGSAGTGAPVRPAGIAIRRLGWLLALALVASLSLTKSASAEIYWANSGNGTGTTIGSAANDGTGVNQSFINTAVEPDYDYPRDVAVNASHIFWTAGGPSGSALTGIGRASIDGSGVDPDFIANPGISYPIGLAVNSTHVYWVDAYADKIGRARLDGTEIEPAFVSLTSPGYVAFGGIEVDDEYIYWTFTGVNDGEGKIGRVATDGSSPDPDFITGLWKPRSVASDSEHLFWCDYQTGVIGRSNPDGTGVNVNFGVRPSGYGCMDLAVSDRSIYYSSWGSGATNLVRLDLDGTNPDTDFITGADLPLGVAVTLAAGDLSPPSHDFGEAEVGTGPTDTETFTLTSTGDAPLTIDTDGITLTGTDPGEFTLVDGIGLGSCQAGATTLADGETCTIEIAFEPGSTGVKAATLEVATNAEPVTASLTGTGTEPPVPTFSAVKLTSKAKRVRAPRKGRKKVAVTVRVTNSGDAAGTATVRLRSSSRKVRVPRRLTVQVGAGSARSRSFKATVLPRAPRKATVTATLADGRKARLVLKIRR